MEKNGDTSGKVIIAFFWRALSRLYNLHAVFDAHEHTFNLQSGEEKTHIIKGKNIR